jgi:hypothetical protein
MRILGRSPLPADNPFWESSYLRPGHIQADFTIATIRELIQADISVEPPFILVAARTGDRLRVRTRHVGPSA